MNAHWGVLHDEVPIPFHDPVPVPRFLQHGSTILGFLIVAAWCALWYRRTPPAAETSLPQLSSFRKLAVVTTMATVAVVAGYPLAIASLADHPPPINAEYFIVTVFEAMTLIFCVQLLIYCVVRRIDARVRRVPRTPANESGG